MKNLVVVMSLIAALVCVTARSNGQMGAMTRSVAGLTLLSAKEVQKELKLSGDQVKQLKEKQKDLGNVGKSHDTASLPNVMTVMGSTDGVEKWASDVLQPDQAKRFHELILQFNGTFALNEASVAKELELKADQKSSISSILEKYDADQQATFMDMARHPQSGKSAKKKIEERKKAAKEELVAVLTPEQETRWKAMAGAPFKFPSTLQSQF